MSIVKVDTRHYRVIAQKNWGLTKEQMRGKHVHHRIKRCDGGTDDPSNLYVCSEWFHDNVWHANDNGFAGCASLGALKANEKKDENGKSLTGLKAAQSTHSKRNEEGKSLAALKVHEEKDKEGRSLHALRLHEEKLNDGRSARAVRNGYKSHEEKTEEGKSARAVKIAENLHARKDELGRSIHAMEALHKERDSDGKSLTGKRIASMVNSRKYICLVTGKISTPGPLTLWQKARGIDPSLRAEVE